MNPHKNYIYNCIWGGGAHGEYIKSSQTKINTLRMWCRTHIQARMRLMPPNLYKKRKNQVIAQVNSYIRNGPLHSLFILYAERSKSILSIFCFVRVFVCAHSPRPSHPLFVAGLFCLAPHICWHPLLIEFLRRRRWRTPRASFWW